MFRYNSGKGIIATVRYEVLSKEDVLIYGLV